MTEKVKIYWSRIREFAGRERVRKIFLGVLTAVLLAVVIFVVIPVFPNAPYALRMVTSNSMEPSFSTGSLVVVVPQEKYKVDDIVTYQASKDERDIVTHRIIERTDEGFKTKGDANSAVDDRTVTLGSIHGRVVFDIPWAGYLVDFIRKPLGFVLVVVIPASIVVLTELRNIYKEIRSKIRKK